MVKSQPTIYLCGPIRGSQDYEWRLSFIRKYGDQVRCLTPVDIGVSDYGNITKFKPSAYMTYRTDLHLIDISDIIVANLLPLDDGYPGRGSLIEIGYAIHAKKLILTVASEQLRSHPFLGFGSDGVFGSFDELDTYLQPYLSVLSGSADRIEPIVNRIESK